MLCYDESIHDVVVPVVRTFSGIEFCCCFELGFDFDFMFPIQICGILVGFKLFHRAISQVVVLLVICMFLNRKGMVSLCLFAPFLTYSMCWVDVIALALSYSNLFPILL